MVCICKEGWCGELGQEGGSLRKGGVNCLKYLKGSRIEKEGEGWKQKFRKGGTSWVKGWMP